MLQFIFVAHKNHTAASKTQHPELLSDGIRSSVPAIGAFYNN